MSTWIRLGRVVWQSLFRNLVQRGNIHGCKAVTKKCQPAVLQHYKRFCYHTMAADFRRRAMFPVVRRNLFHASLLSFIGLKVASPNDGFSADNSISYFLKAFQNKLQCKAEENSRPKFSSLLDDYEIKERLGSPSSCAAVYNAKFNDQPCAIKMMFNYSVRSSSSLILNAFQQEYKVLLSDNCLETHRNIVEMYTAFVDKIPLLSDSVKSYPVALPRGVCAGAVGRNKTLFIAMRRYDCSLKEYLQKYEATFSTRLQLLQHILDGVAHLEKSGVSHRDLKSDNVLIDTSGWPVAVLADFGCSGKMKLRFDSFSVSRGGCACFLAPEIISANPDFGKTLDYSKNDVWACGTLAYEIFSGYNPFYVTLSNADYKDEELPSVNCGDPFVDELVRRMLRRNSSLRLSARQASTLLYVRVHAPNLLKSCTAAQAESWMFSCLIRALRPTTPREDTESQLVFLERTTPAELMETLGVWGAPMN